MEKIFSLRLNVFGMMENIVVRIQGIIRYEPRMQREFTIKIQLRRPLSPSQRRMERHRDFQMLSGQQGEMSLNEESDPRSASAHSLINRLLFI